MVVANEDAWTVAGHGRPISAALRTELLIVPW